MGPLSDREQGTALGISLFPTREAISEAEPAFAQMATQIPAAQRGQLVSVDVYEVLMLDGIAGAKAARLSTLEGPPEQIDAGTRAAIEDVFPRVRALDGFAGVISLGDRSTGTTKLITFWTSTETLDASTAAANALRRQAADAADGSIAGAEHLTVDIVEIRTGIATH